MIIQIVRNSTILLHVKKRKEKEGGGGVWVNQGLIEYICNACHDINIICYITFPMVTSLKNYRRALLPYFEMENTLSPHE